MSQHIGSGFVAVTLAVLLREQGASLQKLSLLSLMILPYSLRFLWSPLVDYLGAQRLGHFRSWLLPVQGLMVLCWLALSAIEPLSQALPLFALLLVFATLIGTQDLALDGLACSAFDRNERLIINSIQIASGMIGNLLGGALVIGYPYLGWHKSLWLLSAFAALPLFLLLFYREPAKAAPPQRSLLASWQSLFLFWRGKMLWLALLALYAMAFSGGFAILYPTLVDSGWKMEAIGKLMNYGVIVGLIAVLAITPLNRRLPRVRSSQILTLIQAISLLALLPLALGYGKALWAYLAVSACYLSFTPMLTTNSATMMDIAAQEASPATAYTVQIAIAMLLSIGANALCLQIAAHFGYAAVIAVAFVCACLALVLLSNILKGLLK